MEQKIRKLSSRQKPTWPSTQLNPDRLGNLLSPSNGSWLEEEAKMHINCLELLAATLPVKSFAKHKFRVSILLRTNNTRAVAYINHLRVSQDLVNLTKNLWMWCLERNIHITAQYLPRSLNTIADA